MHVLLVGHDAIPRHIVLDCRQRFVTALRDQAHLTPEFQQVLVHGSPVVHDLPQLGVLLIQSGKLVHLVLGHVDRRDCLLDVVHIRGQSLCNSLGLGDVLWFRPRLAQHLQRVLGRFKCRLAVVQLVHDADRTLSLQIALDDVSAQLVAQLLLQLALGLVDALHAHAAVDGDEVVRLGVILDAATEDHLDADVAAADGVVQSHGGRGNALRRAQLAVVLVKVPGLQTGSVPDVLVAQVDQAVHHGITRAHHRLTRVGHGILHKLLAVLELLVHEGGNRLGVEHRRLGPVVLLHQLLVVLDVLQRHKLAASGRHHVNQHISAHALPAAAHHLAKYPVNLGAVVKAQDVLDAFPHAADGALELVPCATQLGRHQLLGVDRPELRRVDELVHVVAGQRLLRLAIAGIGRVVQEVQHRVEILLVQLVRVLLDGARQGLAPGLHQSHALLGRHHLLKRVGQLVPDGGWVAHARRALVQADDPLPRHKVTGSHAPLGRRTHAQQQAFQQIGRLGVGSLDDLQHVGRDVASVVLGQSLGQELLGAVTAGLGRLDGELKVAGAIQQPGHSFLHLKASTASGHLLGHPGQLGAQGGVLFDPLLAQLLGVQHILITVGIYCANRGRLNALDDAG